MNFRTRHLATGIMLLAVLFCIDEQKAKAQTLAPAPCQQFFSASGIPLAGGFLYSYTAGTSTLTPTYADSAASIANSNPIILNAGGFPVSATGGCGIWLASGSSYKFVLQNSTHTAQWTVDNITTGSGILTLANTWSMLQTFSAGITGTGSIGTLGLGSGALAANNTWTGTDTFNGSFTATNPCAIDGILYVSQSGCYTSFSAALTQCKSQGSCVIDARGASTVLTIGTFDPNITTSTNAAVTVLLGPYTYSVTQIVLRSNLQIIGSGPINPTGTPGTVLQQATAGTAPIALPTSGSNIAATVAQGVRLSNFALSPAPSSTSDGISLIAAGCGAGCSGGGLWYSTFDHISIGNFGRNEIRIDGTQCDKCSAVQFDSFRDVWAYRAINNPPVLLITGPFLGQTTFDDCQFDLNFGQTDTSANIVNVQIDDTPSSLVSCPGGDACWVPYSIKFQNTTMQFADGTGGIALLVKGAQNVSCDNCHFEHDSTIASAIQGPGGHDTFGFVIMNSYIDGLSGTGGLINIDANSSLFFHNNTEGINPPSGGFLVSGSVPTFLDWGGNMNNVGGASFSPLPEPTLTIAQLPGAADAVGIKRMVSDSTSISSEGQTCTHASSGAVTAIAISNGTVWKCF